MIAGRIKRKLAKLIESEVEGMTVDPMLMNSIPNGGSLVYDPASWDARGMIGGKRVWIHSYDTMTNCCGGFTLHWDKWRAGVELFAL